MSQNQWNQISLLLLLQQHKTQKKLKKLKQKAKFNRELILLKMRNNKYNKNYKMNRKEKNN